MRKVFAKAGESMEDELKQIRKLERRINLQHEKQILKLDKIIQNKKMLATELRKIIDSVKQLDYDNKEIQNSLAAKENTIEEKMKDLTGGVQVQKIKEAIFKLKVSDRVATDLVYRYKSKSNR